MFSFIFRPRSFNIGNVAIFSSRIKTLRGCYTNIQRHRCQCSLQFIVGSTGLHGTRNTNFLISFWRKQYINGFSSEFKMAQVRTNSVDTTKATFSLLPPITDTEKIVKAMGRKLSNTALTTNAVVLSALFSLTNLCTSSWGNCCVLIFLSWRRDSRYKIV